MERHDRASTITHLDPFGPRDTGGGSGSLRASIPLLICALGAFGLAMTGTDPTDDGASVLPLLALAGIAIAVLRHRPDVRHDPIRIVGPEIAVATVLVSTSLVVATVVAPATFGALFGPAITTALIGSYLAVWGVRSPALLRSVTLLSMLTWTAVASLLHEVVRSSLAQPSDMIYRRLASLPALGIDDQPWRLHTASLHHGALVVIATVVLVVAITRQRFTPHVVGETLATAALALAAHHVVVLASSLDQYQPDEMTKVASHPALEIGIAAIGVLVLIAVRRWRHAARRVQATAHVSDRTFGFDPTRTARDPYIFDLSHASAPIGVTVALFSGLAAVGALVAFAAL